MVRAHWHSPAPGASFWRHTHCHMRIHIHMYTYTLTYVHTHAVPEWPGRPHSSASDAFPTTGYLTNCFSTSKSLIMPHPNMLILIIIIRNYFLVCHFPCPPSQVLLTSHHRPKPKKTWDPMLGCAAAQHPDSTTTGRDPSPGFISRSSGLSSPGDAIPRVMPASPWHSIPELF